MPKKVVKQDHDLLMVQMGADNVSQHKPKEMKMDKQPNWPKGQIPKKTIVLKYFLKTYFHKFIIA